MGVTSFYEQVPTAGRFDADAAVAYILEQYGVDLSGDLLGDPENLARLADAGDLGARVGLLRGYAAASAAGIAALMLGQRNRMRHYLAAVCGATGGLDPSGETAANAAGAATSAAYASACDAALGLALEPFVR